MKPSLLPLFCLLTLSIFFTNCLSAQQRKFIPQHSDRYKLDLPAEWIKKTRLVRVVTDILPKTIIELADRDFCTECKAGFTISLYIDSIRVYNEHTSAPIQMGRASRYTFSFNYSFYAALLLRDSSGRPLSMLRLNDSQELLHYSKNYSLEPKNFTTRNQPVYDTAGRIIDRRIVEELPMVITDLPKHTAGSVLTESFLQEICERSIYEIDRFLRKFN